MRAGKDECATPAKLVQNYVVCQLDKKLDVLLGFIKTHLKSKMIVFFTSCAQVGVRDYFASVYSRFAQTGLACGLLGIREDIQERYILLIRPLRFVSGLVPLSI